MNARIEHRICWRVIGFMLFSALLSVTAPAFSCTAYAVEEEVDSGAIERDSTGGSGAFVGGGCSQDSSDCAGKTTEDSSLQVVESHDPSTTEQLSGWQWNGLSWYYYLDGCRLTGIQNIDDSLYYLDPARDGAMSCGWIFTENKWYYAGPSGALASGWQFIGDQWYWFDSLNSCSMATGRRVIDGQIASKMLV